MTLRKQSILAAIAATASFPLIGLFGSSPSFAQDGQVVEEDKQIVEQEPGQVGGKTVERGEAKVKVREKQRITRTLIDEENIPTAKACEQRADINRMDEKDFAALGFDPQAAKRIVETREKKGQFKSVDELAQVQGVDEQMVSDLKNSLTAAKTG